MLALPLVLASASGIIPPTADRHARHRDLARQYTPSSSSELNTRDFHPVLGRRTLEPKAAQVPLGGFEVVGDSGVSAQMMFLGTAETVYILDSKWSEQYHATRAHDQRPKTIPCK
jgi:hypothetical protein